MAVLLLREGEGRHPHFFAGKKSDFSILHLSIFYISWNYNPWLTMEGFGLSHNQKKVLQFSNGDFPKGSRKKKDMSLTRLAFYISALTSEVRHVSDV